MQVVAVRLTAEELESLDAAAAKNEARRWSFTPCRVAAKAGIAEVSSRR